MRPLVAVLAVACAAAAPEAPSLVALVGDCDGGEQITADGLPEGPAYPVGDLADYSTRLVVRHASEGHVRARADAHWNDDHRNVLGYLPSGAVLWGQGPLKDTEGSGGLGYAIPVRDLDGETCRVFVSATVVDLAP